MPVTGEPAHEGFAAHGAQSGDEWHVTVRGELDRSTRGLLVLACLEGGSRPVVVDLAGVTFMDAAGFGGLVTARAVIAARGTSLAVRNATGAADHLLEVLEASEPARGGYWPQRFDRMPSPERPIAGPDGSAGGIDGPGDGTFDWAE